MLRLLLTTVFLTIFSIASAADNPVPDRHQVVTRDIDFYGSDLEPLFDTTFEACQRAGGTFPDAEPPGIGPLGEITTRPWGEESFYVNDPFGNKLCFVRRDSVFTG